MFLRSRELSNKEGDILHSDILRRNEWKLVSTRFEHNRNIGQSTHHGKIQDSSIMFRKPIRRLGIFQAINLHKPKSLGIIFHHDCHIFWFACVLKSKYGRTNVFCTITTYTIQRIVIRWILNVFQNIKVFDIACLISVWQSKENALWFC